MTRMAAGRRVEAVFFDVDYTLIHPGPVFDGEGYRAFARTHGLDADPARYEAAVREASSELDHLQEQIYRPEPFVRYARRVLTGMGATGDGLDACAMEIYEEWAACHHFTLYDDVQPAFAALCDAGYRIGLISNTHRSLEAFQTHFELKPYVTAAVSSYEQGYLKPHPSIFEAALAAAGADAAVSVMVGDSLAHDIAGAHQVGMSAVLLIRASSPHLPGTATILPDAVREVAVIYSLTDLTDVLQQLQL